MGSNKQRIVVQSLGTRGLVVGVVQTDERIP